MMVRTQLLTLYRQRMLFWLVGVGLFVIVPAAAVLLVQLLVDGEPRHAVALGVAFGFASTGTLVLAVLFGTTAGSRDYSSGVMRDYVLTGAARWQIHASQVVAAAIVVAGLLAAAAVLVILVLAATMGIDAVRDAADADTAAFGSFEVARALLAGVVVLAVLVVSAHGVGTLVRSRGISIAILAGYLLIVDGIIAVVNENASFRSAMATLLRAIMEPSTLSSDQWPAMVAAAIWVAGLVGLPLFRLYRSDL